MSRFTYKNQYLREISFPVGGIGTGSIGLAGNGAFVDWEIFNRPNKTSVNGFSHIAVKAERKGRVLAAKVLHGDFPGERTGKFDADGFEAYGLGPQSTTMAGFPHFEDCVFEGKFPMAEVSFKSKSFPGRVKLCAFNPLIPLDSFHSSLPAFFAEVYFTNTEKEEITYTACFSLRNPLSEGTVNRLVEKENCFGLFMTSKGLSSEDKEYGNLCLLTDNSDVNVQEYWFRGEWSDAPETFWRQFSTGKLPVRSYEKEGKMDTGSVEARITLRPGERKGIRFLLSWSFLNQYNYWRPYHKTKDGKRQDVTWKNWYATQFPSALESGIYALKEFGSLKAKTKCFQKTLFSVTAPEEVKEAVSATLSVLKSPTVLRLEDGSFYGWEGVMKRIGSCEGSCTHVWNYAYALPFLFPDLERSMRDLDYRYNMASNGKMQFRLMLPLGRPRDHFHACVDGQMGGVIKTYREWKISGDDAWLKGKWSRVKKALSYAWADTNEDCWDKDKDGVLEGRQHHTLDMELFGPSSWLQGFYVCALKAAMEMAEHLGDKKAAAEYQSLYLSGRKYLNTELFNGEYFYHKVDLKNKELLSAFSGAQERYWNDEAGEIKYQIADGCEIDQAVAQWHANLCGLGEIFEREKLHTALRSIYRYNFKESMRDFVNPWRNFCINDESGTVMCEYPKKKPAIPISYCQETMHGFEYSLAALMIQEGMTEEGFRLVRAVRDRYTGEWRNPWNEIECGSNYARSMAAFSLLNALSGFTFDMAHCRLSFAPKYEEKGEFSTMWSLQCGWGTYKQKKGEYELRVLAGELPVSELTLPKLTPDASVIADGKKVEARVEKNTLYIPKTTVKKRMRIRI